ncbi:MAG: ABC transporter permease, partial [Bacteroidota bacterium]
MIQNHLLIFWRNLYRRPGHSLLNLTCLVTGILSVLLILLYLNFELNYDHFHQQSDHIYRVTTPRVDLTNKQLDINSQNTFLNLGPYLTKDFPEVAAFVRCYGFTSSMRLAWASQNIEEERLQAADQALLDVFSFELLEGSREKALDGPNKIVLSESLARRIFGSGQAAGKLLDAEYVHFITNEEKAHPLMVTAVFKDLPHNSSLTAEAYVSVQTDSELDNYYFNRLGGLTYVLLHDKVDPQAFAPKLSNIYDQYLDPDLEPVMRRAHHELVPLRELHMRASGGYSYIYVFGSIAFLLLLIAAISYVNLATAQASRRSLEVGIRKVVGSSRAQLIWQFLSESLLYILLALALAIFALYKSLPLLNNLLDIQLDAAQLWQPQLSVGILVLVMLLALFGGAYPAFFLSAFRPISAVKGRLASGTVVRKFLLSLQFAVVLFVLKTHELQLLINQPCTNQDKQH